MLHVPDVAASYIDLSSFHLGPKSSEFYLWHSCLGHISSSRLQYLISTGSLGKRSSHDILDHSGCKLAKFTALPFNNSSFSSAPFDLVHSNL